METYAPTCPFGPRSLSVAVLRTHWAVRDCPAGQPVHKWKVFRLFCETKDRIGVSDRSLALLDALRRFHPDTVLVASDVDLVVIPSNRHLAALVDAGLVLRRDSANGKRYARKPGGAGEIVQTFGFDLGPLVARAEEFAALAEAVRMERQLLIRARERVTLLRRDVVKSITAGTAMDVAAGWPSWQAAFSELVAHLDRTGDRCSGARSKCGGRAIKGCFRRTSAETGDALRRTLRENERTVCETDARSSAPT